MVWKPKEKELTPEEAIEIARKELTPYWFGTKPLIAGVKHDNKVSALPLDPNFNESARMVFFVDPTDYSGINTLALARELYERYHVHGMNALLVLRPGFSYFLNRDLVELFLRKEEIEFIAVVDHDGLLSQAFRLKEWPKFMILHEGNPVIDRSGVDWIKGTELEIQKFMRKFDPGLPLLPLFEMDENFLIDKGRLDFGADRGAPFPPKGFVKLKDGFRAAKFPAKPRPEKMAEGELMITGQWMQDADRIATSDPTAQIAFKSPSSSFAIIAQGLSKTLEVGKIVIEVNGMPAFDIFKAGDLQFDEDGQSVIKTEGPRPYHAVVKLPPNEREVTLKFPLADRASVAVYGIRFGELRG